MAFLEGLDLRSQLPHIAASCPGILACSVDEDLAPALHFLQSELAVPDATLTHALQQAPQLLLPHACERMRSNAAFLAECVPAAAPAPDMPRDTVHCMQLCAREGRGLA